MAPHERSSGTERGEQSAESSLTKPNSGLGGSGGPIKHKLASTLPLSWLSSTTKAFKVVETFCALSAHSPDGQAVVQGMVPAYAIHARNLLAEARQGQEIKRLAVEKVREGEGEKRGTHGFEGYTFITMILTAALADCSQKLHDLKEEKKQKNDPPTQDDDDDTPVYQEKHKDNGEEVDNEEEQDILNEGEDPAEQAFMPLRLLERLDLLVALLLGPMSNRALSQSTKEKLRKDFAIKLMDAKFTLSYVQPNAAKWHSNRRAAMLRR